MVFVAVRQGDAAIYQGACGDVGVIDVNRYRAGDVLAALDTYASRNLKWIAASGYDADHLGGIIDLAESPGVTVGTFYDRGGDRTVKDTATYRTYYDYVTGLGDRQPVDIGDTFTLCTGADTVTFTVISQGTDGTAIGGVPVTEENDRGLCLHVEYGDFDLATCGDINGTDAGSRTDVETPAAAAIGDVEVVKINHHGSSYSSNQTWVNTLNAEVAVVSVGKNSYGHPSATVMNRWQASGAITFQTNSTTVSTGLIDGNIQIRTNGTNTFTYQGIGKRQIRDAIRQSLNATHRLVWCVSVSEGSVHEGCELATSHIARRAEPVIRRRIAALRHTSRSELVDVVPEDRPGRVSEQVPSAVIGVVQRTNQERCKLFTGDLRIRTEPVIRRRVTALRDTRCSQPLNVPLKDRVIIIDERVVETIRQPQSTDQEGCHLATSHHPIRTEPVISRRVTALRDAFLGHPLNVLLKHRPIIIRERVPGAQAPLGPSP